MPVVNSGVRQGRFHPDSLLEAGRVGTTVLAALCVHQARPGAGTSLCGCTETKVQVLTPDYIFKSNGKL